MKRVVFTLALGTPTYAKCALGLGRSLRLIGDTTRRVVVTDQLDAPWLNSFHEVIPWKPTGRSPYLEKLSGLDFLDADQIMFIDSDCLVFRRLDPIFEFAAGHDFCVQGHPVSEGKWYGDVASHCLRHNLCAMPKFNGGMIYYERTQRAQTLISTAFELWSKASELGFDDDRTTEEPILSLAMAKTGIGIQSPLESDFMSAATGLVGRLHLNVNKNKCSFVVRDQTTRHVQPYIFHAWNYMTCVCYWRQLAKLEKLEKYELTHRAGFLPYGQRLRRSVERRIISLFGMNR